MGNSKGISYYPIFFMILSLATLYFVYTMNRDFVVLADIAHKQNLMLKKSNELIFHLLTDSNNVNINTHFKIKEVISYQQALYDGMGDKHE